MSDASVTPEPSMDEILHKIQRSISEDGMADRRPSPDTRSAEILHLTKALNDNGTVRDLDPVEPAAQADGVPQSPQPAEQQIETTLPSQASGGRLLSQATAGAAAAALAQLAAIKRERRRLSEFPISGALRTVEDVVRELLRPMLQDWLNEKLPDTIERLMRAEFARALGDIDAA